MAAIMKLRARGFLVHAPISSTGFYPDGVGGLTKGPAREFDIGDYRVFLTEAEWLDLVRAMDAAKAAAA